MTGALTVVRPRTWGDGLTTRYRHQIADIKYTEAGPSCLVCGCSLMLDAATPEALAVLWRGHGGKVLEVHGATDPSDVYSADEGRDSRLSAMVAALRQRCTCDTTAITDCPNYVSGDERD